MNAIIPDPNENPKLQGHKNPDRRGSWDSYFMKLAHMAATRATCPQRAVGAVIVQDKRVRGTGYNGAPANTPSCLEEGCLLVEDGACTRTIHAELNALLDTDPLKRKGATLYTTHRPCFRCANAIVNAGIKEVVYATDHKNMAMMIQLFDSAGVTHRRYDLSPEWKEMLLPPTEETQAS